MCFLSHPSKLHNLTLTPHPSGLFAKQMRRRFESQDWAHQACHKVLPTSALDSSIFAIFDDSILAIGLPKQTIARDQLEHRTLSIEHPYSIIFPMKQGAKELQEVPKPLLDGV